MNGRLIRCISVRRCVADALNVLIFPDPLEVRFNDPEILSLEIGAANGVGNARSLAGIYDAYNQGKLIKKGGPVWERMAAKVPLVFTASASEAHLRVVEISTEGRTRDQVIYLPIDWNAGYWSMPNSLGDTEIGHPGYGGQNVKVCSESSASKASLHSEALCSASLRGGSATRT